MQISLRSQLIAGTAAVVGASAIAMTPVLPAQLSLPSVQVPSAAQVALAGFDSPLTELLNSGVLATNYLFNGFGDPADPANWGYSGIGAFIAGALSTPDWSLAWTPVYSRVGLLQQITDDALPIASQLVYNAGDYLQATTTSVYAAGFYLSEGLWNLPENVIKGIQAGSISDVVGAFVDPVIQAGSALLNAVGYIGTGIVTRASAVVQTLIDLVPKLFETVIGQVSVLAGRVGKVFTDLVDAFSAPNPVEGAWNALVDSLLGPSGVPGTLINLTLGMGVQTKPGDPTSFVPSVRTAVQSGVKDIANALSTPVVSSTAAVRPGAAARTATPAAALTAADVKPESTDTTDTTTVTAAPDNGSTATSGDSTPAPKPAASHRSSRKAASNN